MTGRSDRPPEQRRALWEQIALGSGIGLAVSGFVVVAGYLIVLVLLGNV